MGGNHCKISKINKTTEKKPPWHLTSNTTVVSSSCGPSKFTSTFARNSNQSTHFYSYSNNHAQRCVRALDFGYFVAKYCYYYKAVSTGHRHTTISVANGCTICWPVFFFLVFQRVQTGFQSSIADGGDNVYCGHQAYTVRHTFCKLHCSLTAFWEPEVRVSKDCDVARRIDFYCLHNLWVETSFIPQRSFSSAALQVLSSGSSKKPRRKWSAGSKEKTVQLWLLFHVHYAAYAQTGQG